MLYTIKADLLPDPARQNRKNQPECFTGWRSHRNCDRGLSGIRSGSFRIRSQQYGLCQCETGFGIHDLKERMARLVAPDGSGKRLVADLVHPLDVVILIVPIDKAAPKGRLILPQQQVIRDLLDSGAMPIVCRESELAAALDSLKEKAVSRHHGQPSLSSRGPHDSERDPPDLFFDPVCEI